jgi:hypothetical protein
MGADHFRTDTNVRAAHYFLAEKTNQ